MASNQENDERAATSVKVAECIVAAVIIALGVLVMVDSLRLGNRWVSDGPQAGYFPFYIGVILCISGAVNALRALRDPYVRTFVTRGQGKLVLLVLVPLVGYVALIALLGIYVASTIYIALFMIWLGKYGWAKTAAVSLGVSLAFFLMFEVWFKVPLIKGPLETALGLN
ncbi:MAG: tripartite tricarboxylate transporter TctB family protein [Betaproteobacteria bacterium]|nr:tripartite tricarboxylate transporter TctB family protein [Betaproteobacteria bacterium]